MRDLAAYESQFTQQRLEVRGMASSQAMPLSDQILNNILGSKLDVSNKEMTTGDISEQYVNKQVDSTVQQIKDSELSGDDWEDTVGTIEDKGSSGLLFSAMAVAATAVNFITNKVKLETYKENNIPNVVWVAELDSSVCPDCEDLNGTSFSADDTDIPPEHWNCRCILEPEEDD
jgi:SPP1 gp7 family putative phage head morphogenesis protein